MKVEFYEETTIQKKQRFVADDGTIFDTEFNCIEYEERCKLDAIPFPETLSVPIPLEEYDVKISLLKSPLDFKKLLTEYEDTPASRAWNIYEMDEPRHYPCLYTYYEDDANYYAGSLTYSPAQLIQKYEKVVRTMAAWCAEQLETATTV